MAVPSVTGTPVFNNEVAATNDTVTITVPANATSVVVCYGGFASGASVSVSSVQDTTGTAFDIDNQIVFSQTTTDQQWCGASVIHDTDADWATGSRDYTVTVTSGGFQLKVGAFCLTDTDTAGTPINGVFESLTMSDSSANPSQSVTSTTNALDIAVVASYSADLRGGADNTDIGSDYNTTSSSSLFAWSEAGAASSNTLEADSAVNHAMVLLSFEGTSGGGGSALPLINAYHG